MPLLLLMLLPALLSLSTSCQFRFDTVQCTLATLSSAHHQGVPVVLLSAVSFSSAAVSSAQVMGDAGPLFPASWTSEFEIKQGLAANALPTNSMV